MPSASRCSADANNTWRFVPARACAQPSRPWPSSARTRSLGSIRPLFLAGDVQSPAMRAMSLTLAGAPPSNTCRLLARDHAAPEPTLLLTKVVRPWLVGVRPLAWCSRPRNSAVLLDEALGVREDVEELDFEAVAAATRQLADPVLLLEAEDERIHHVLCRIELIEAEDQR